MSQAYLRLDVEKFAHLFADSLVEIEEIVPTLLKERADIILIIIEERRLAIGALKGVPMQMAPVAVVADTEVLNSVYS